MGIPSYLFDLGTYLQTNGIGTLGTNIHYRTFDNVQINDVVLIPAGGSGNNNITNIKDILYSPKLVINIRNRNADDAETKANQIFDLLNLITNRYIGSTRFKRIEALSPPWFLGQDPDDNFLYSVNFSLQLQE